MTGNYLPDVKKSFVELDPDGYDDDDGKLYAKMKVQGSLLKVTPLGLDKIVTVSVLSL